MMYQSIKNHNYPPDPFNLGVSLNGGTPPISDPPKGSFLVGKKPMEIVGYSTTICRKTFPPHVGFTRFPVKNLHQRHRISCSFFEAPNPAPQQGLKSWCGARRVSRVFGRRVLLMDSPNLKEWTHFYHEFIACYFLLGIIKSKDYGFLRKKKRFKNKFFLFISTWYHRITQNLHL